MVKEASLYKPIHKWLEKEGYVVNDSWRNTGVGRYRVDVIGIKNSGNNYCDDIEIVAVEVKIHGNYTTLGQAGNYRDFAHRVFFATTDYDTAERLKDHCNQKNLGLLRVDKNTKKVTKIIDAPLIKPRNEVQMIEFLRKLYISKCTICGCYFDLRAEWDTAVVFKSSPKFSKADWKIKRYVCNDCKQHLDKLYGYNYWGPLIKTAKESLRLIVNIENGIIGYMIGFRIK
jgi:hypothetical protein